MPTDRPTDPKPTLHLARWTVTSGSNARSRGAVILEAGDHHWRASAEGNGAIDALYQWPAGAVAARPDFGCGEHGGGDRNRAHP